MKNINFQWLAHAWPEWAALNAPEQMALYDPRRLCLYNRKWVRNNRPDLLVRHVNYVKR